MGKVYFPGCKVQAAYPHASAKLTEAIFEHSYASTQEGCCRTRLQNLTPDDTAVCVCVNCMGFIEESAQARHVESIWEIIDADPAFPLPDHTGMVVSVQDCGRSHERRGVQDAIRSLLKKMNIQVIEAPDAFEKTTYCGAKGYQDSAPIEKKLAPWRYTKSAPARGVFVPHPEEDIQQLLVDHAAKIPADTVVCYCTACDTGIEAGGKHALHIIELIFGEEK